MFLANLRARSRRVPTTIQSLPDDILRIIFHAVIYAPARRSLARSTPLPKEGASSPFPLLQVNSRWRRLLSSMRGIWTSIYIECPSQKHIERVSVWLQYIAGRSLCPTVVTSVMPSLEEQNALCAIIDILARNIDCWAVVRFELYGNLPQNLVHHLRELRDEPRPSLNSFYLRLPPNDQETFQLVSIWDSVNVVSSLRAFKWACARTPGLQVSSRLQTLELGSPITLDDLLTRVSTCEHLVNLRVREVRRPSAEFNTDALQPVAFYRLRELVLEMDDADPTVLLDNIDAPNLNVFGIRRVRHEHFAAVSRLCRRAGAAETLLAVSVLFSQTPSEEEVLEWLWMPEIQRVSVLSILGVRVSEAILDTLTLSAHATVSIQCLPNLKSLQLGTVWNDVDGAVVLRMLGSRFWPPPPACAMHEMDGIHVSGVHCRMQLRSAMMHVNADAHTPQMKRYQMMFEQSVAHTPGWKSHKLEFCVE